MAVPVSNNGKRLTAPQESTDTYGFRLEYNGKKPESEILATPPGQFRLNSAYCGNPNRLYHADNLDVLASLVRDTNVCGQVRLVYIDPPFGTGGGFESRTQAYAYDDSVFGPDFVESLRERLVLLRQLMADNGSLYLHLDSRMIAHFRIILDEIFGKINFRNCITRKKSNPKNYTKKNYGNISDYILFYTKTGKYIWNRAVEPWDSEKIAKEYPCLESDGRRYKKVPVHAPGNRNGATGKEWRGKLPPPGKHWQYRPQTLDEMDARGEIYWSPSGNPRRKVYLDSSDGIPVQDIWTDVQDAHNQNIYVTGYPTEKNAALLERIIRASSNPGDIVMDCYSGSGTTLAVASNLGRRWIGVDCSAEAISTTLRRFESGAAPMGDFVNDNKAYNLPWHNPITDFSLYDAL